MNFDKPRPSYAAPGDGISGSPKGPAEKKLGSRKIDIPAQQFLTSEDTANLIETLTSYNLRRKLHHVRESAIDLLRNPSTYRIVDHSHDVRYTKDGITRSDIQILRFKKIRAQNQTEELRIRIFQRENVRSIAFDTASVLNGQVIKSPLQLSLVESGNDRRIEVVNFSGQGRPTPSPIEGKILTHEQFDDLFKQIEAEMTRVSIATGTQVTTTSRPQRREGIQQTVILSNGTKFSFVAQPKPISFGNEENDGQEEA